MQTPYLLLGYQQRWIADKSPIKVCEKSRRIGISWAEAADCALLAAETGRHGSDVYYIGYNEDMARVWIEDVAWWSRNYQLAASEMESVVIKDDDKDILAYQIRFASGNKVTALSSRPNNLRGKQGKIVIDEAAFHPELGELLKAAIALLMWGGRISIISTHDGIDNPFNQLIEEIRALKKAYSLHTITIDDALKDGLYERICLAQGIPYTLEGEFAWRAELFKAYGDAANEELLCIPRSNSEIYFPGTLIEARMSSDYSIIRLNLANEFNLYSEFDRRKLVDDWIKDHLEPLLSIMDRNLRHYYGMDFGRTQDLSVIAPIVELAKLKRCCPFLIELRNVPIRQQEQILYFMADRLPNFTAAAMDGRGNGQAIAEFAKQRYGSRVEAVMLTAEKYRDMVPRYKASLEDGMFVMPKDADVLADHRAVKLENGVPKIPDTGRFKGSDGNKRHGDSFVALVMGYYAATEHAGVHIGQLGQAAAGSDRHTARNVFTISDAYGGKQRVPTINRGNIRGLF